MAGERKFIMENVRRVLLKEHLKEQVKRAGFGGVDIQRTPMGTRVTLITERPGLVIGRKGSSIKTLTDTIEFDFGFDKPQVEVVEVENPNLSAQIMAEKLASALERGWHFRRAGHSTVRRVMDNGARGCQVIIAGKLTGQRHRTEKFKEGHIKYCGEPKLQWMEEGYTPAKLKQGVIGVKVQIMHPKAKLPDEVEIMAADKMPPLPPSEEAPAAEQDAFKVEPEAEEPGMEPEKAPAKDDPKPEKKGPKPSKGETKPEEGSKDKPKEKPKAQKDEPEPEPKPEKDVPKPKEESTPEDKPTEKEPAEVKPSGDKAVEKAEDKPGEKKAVEKAEEKPAEGKEAPEKTEETSDSVDRAKGEAEPPGKEEESSGKEGGKENKPPKDGKAKEDTKDGTAED